MSAHRSASNVLEIQKRARQRQKRRERWQPFGAGDDESTGTVSHSDSDSDSDSSDSDSGGAGGDERELGKGGSDSDDEAESGEDVDPHQFVSEAAFLRRWRRNFGRAMARKYRKAKRLSKERARRRHSGGVGRAAHRQNAKLIGHHRRHVSEMMKGGHDVAEAVAAASPSRSEDEEDEASSTTSASLGSGVSSVGSLPQLTGSSSMPPPMTALSRSFSSPTAMVPKRERRRVRHLFSKPRQVLRRREFEDVLPLLDAFSTKKHRSGASLHDFATLYMTTVDDTTFLQRKRKVNRSLALRAAFHPNRKSIRRRMDFEQAGRIVSRADPDLQRLSLGMHSAVEQSISESEGTSAASPRSASWLGTSPVGPSAFAPVAASPSSGPGPLASSVSPERPRRQRSVRFKLRSDEDSAAESSAVGNDAVDYSDGSAWEPGDLLSHEEWEDTCRRLFRQRMLDEKRYRVVLHAGVEVNVMGEGHAPERNFFMVFNEGSEIAWGCDEARVREFVRSRETGRRQSWFERMAGKLLRKARTKTFSRELADVVGIKYGSRHSERFNEIERHSIAEWHCMKIEFADETHLALAFDNDTDISNWLFGLQALSPMSHNFLSVGNFLWIRAGLKLRDRTIREHVYPNELLRGLVEEAWREGRHVEPHPPPSLPLTRPLSYQSSDMLVATEEPLLDGPVLDGLMVETVGDEEDEEEEEEEEEDS